MKIIKRDDKREDFDSNKLRRAIEKAAAEANIERNRATEIADSAVRDVEEHFKNRDEVKSADIKKRVLEVLDNEGKKVADAARNFKKQ
jgi:transcriptional regulator NrdR family protein